MALGSTSWQAVTRAILPSVRTGVAAAVLVAFGRALGETMAVLMVSGAAINQLLSNIFQAVNTIAAVIVSQLDSALTDSSGSGAAVASRTGAVAVLDYSDRQHRSARHPTRRRSDARKAMSSRTSAIVSRAWWSVSVLSLLAVVGVLLFVFFFVVVQGLPALRPSLFTSVTNGVAGGLENAIAGTQLLVGYALVLVVVVGLGTATWIAEFASPPLHRSTPHHGGLTVAKSEPRVGL